MRQYEHKIETIHISKLEDTIKKYEQDFWEVAGIAQPNEWSATIVFKRLKIDFKEYIDKTIKEHTKKELNKKKDDNYLDEDWYKFPNRQYTPNYPWQFPCTTPSNTPWLPIIYC